ncbi:MAG: hypothetical protein IKV57_09285 [Clostridia bacterium]|nr:hypothetical protein [Clostridia bacterium]
MYYLMILAAVVLLALQFCTNKFYQLRFGNAVTTSLLFTALGGLTTALLFFCIGGFRLSVTPYSLTMAAIIAVLCCLYTLIGFKMFALGNMSVYTMFLMLGGMLLPYLYGVFWLNEEITVCRILGVILLALSMVFPVLGTGDDENKKKTRTLFLLLCLVVFTLNGFVSITSKMHQISDRFIVGENDFVVLSNGMNGLISSAALFVMCLSRRTTPLREPLTAKSMGLIAGIIGVSAACNGTSYMLQLIGAANVPASVLYPMVTGGMMVLSAVAGMVFFKEYPDKKTAVGLLLSFAATFLFLF